MVVRGGVDLVRVVVNIVIMIDLTLLLSFCQGKWFRIFFYPPLFFFFMRYFFTGRLFVAGIPYLLLYYGNLDIFLDPAGWAC